MAFVFREKRNTSSHVPNVTTSSAIGPGIYNIERSRRAINPSGQRVSYAPFSSSAERSVMHEDYDYSPGPGQYKAPSSIKTSKAAVASNAFLNRVPRFGIDERSDKSPGPGSYQQDDQWRKAAAKRRQQQQGNRPARRHGGSGVTSGGGGDGSGGGKVLWERVIAPPSIPSQSQSYGYEQNTMGELVPQKCPISGYAGTREDGVGPGSYGARNTRSEKGTAWSRSKVHRTTTVVGQQEQATPGPGNYDTANSLRVGNVPIKTSNQFSRVKNHSMFASNVKRMEKVTAVDETPGPGSYIAPGAFDRVTKKKTPAQFQFFGSRGSRSLTRDLSASGVGDPGPGSYYKPTSMGDDGSGSSSGPSPMQQLSLGLGLKAADTQKRLRNARAPFKSSSARFAARRIVRDDPSPGPGAYATRTHDLVNELDRRMFGRNGSFGTTTTRFRKQSGTAGDDAVPGPGAYVEKKVVKPKRPYSMFVSQSRRYVPGESNGTGRATSLQTPTPAPGQYDVGTGNSWDAYNGAGASGSGDGHALTPSRLSAVFAGRRSRFDGPGGVHTMAGKSMSTLGPGSYDVAPGVTGGGTGSGTGSGVSSAFVSSNARFKPRRVNSVVPGPGTYSQEVEQCSLLKPSFNITIGAADL